jgi:hypothetical protein
MKKSPDTIWTMSDGKLNITLLANDCNEIYSFTGPVAKVLNDFLAKPEFNLDRTEVESFLGEKIGEEDILSLKKFCLEKKIIIED